MEFVGLVDVGFLEAKKSESPWKALLIAGYVLVSRMGRVGIYHLGNNVFFVDCWSVWVGFLCLFLG